MSETYPDHPPLVHPLMRGTATVTSNDGVGFFTVNLDTVECDCKHGAAWRYANKRWVPNGYCSHKLKALASLVNRTKDASLRDFYEEQVGRRYNAFVAVSAMHKELRRGDTEAALYWATVMLPHRGKHGVISYLRNIVFEETRDLALAKYVLKVSTYGKSVSMLDMQRAVARFCAAPKKWELPWRHDIFLSEMRGYRTLAKTYGYDVAKGRDIIDEGETQALRDALFSGFASADPVLMQVGLKGWYKSKSPDHDKMRLQIFNALTDVLNGEHPNKFEFDEDYAHALHSFLLRRLRHAGNVRYHDLNALADALSGEPGADPRATLSKKLHKAEINYPRVRRIKLGELRRVPLYANDNHTWAGKAKMRTYGAVQLRPGAKQTDLDFRLCGAYMGVAWRTLAYAQYGTIDVKWGDVKWKPKWLWRHLDSMWY